MKNRLTTCLVSGLLACLGVQTSTAQTDVTDAYIKNASFENGFTDWSYAAMQTQTNSDFSRKEGDTYVEQWVSSGSHVADAYLTQTLTDLPNGVYTLTASAQNIQQNSSATQSGACIFAGEQQTAVSAADDYSVTFTVIDGQTAIGFKTENATGNWIACDNFRLEALDHTLDDLHTALQQRMNKATELLEEEMQASARTTLESAIQDAQEEMQATTAENLSAVAARLSEAIAMAQNSIDACSTLQAAIDKATEAYGDGSLAGAEELNTAIQTAKERLNDAEASPDDLTAAATDLETAILSFAIANATGTAPTVVTDTRYARGSTIAFGRSTISNVPSSGLLEQGFCWSTEPEPTVLDNRSTEYVENNGHIYVMRNLEPSTVYYVRAYAMTKDYAVGYGDDIKIITIPKGTITWSYDNGGPADANTRINAAVSSAVDYWNELTSIKGLNLSVHYGAQTPTADCSYGGWMRVGPNASYQRTGTIMHEMGHAIGVGTHSMWNGTDTPLRAGAGTGDWLGDRANEVLRFWDNNPTAVMTGDGTHMWPYGINGAHEDTGSEVLYFGNGLITQALGEDGLPPTGGFCTPAYVFEQEDNVKYYIKNEDSSRGLYTGYLTVNDAGTLSWAEMESSEAINNDYAAWYITFDPYSCYYYFRNAGNGMYLTYNDSRANAFRAKSTETPATTERFHLMRGRVDASIGEGADAFTSRGYWIIYPNNTATPDCLAGSVNGRTSTTTLDLTDAAQNQRWLFLTEDELTTFESAVKDEARTALDELLANIKALVDTPHKEDVSGADNTINGEIADIEAQADGEDITTEQINELTTRAMTAGLTFLGQATPASVEQPFDITFLLSDAGLTDGTGWTGTPKIDFSCGEFFQQAFDFNQTVSGLPAGTYQFKGQAFQRPGAAAAVYAAYTAGTDNVEAVIYAGNTEEKLQNIAAEAQRVKRGGDEIAVGSPVRYVPNDMEAASIYFAAGLYDNAVVTELAEDGSNLRVGVRGTVSNTAYWCIFDNFRLYAFGSMTPEEVTDIRSTMTDGDGPAGLSDRPADVYNLSGMIVRRKATSLEGLPRGIYIVNGKKAVVK